MPFFAQDLILVDPDDNMKVSEILNFFKRPVVKVAVDDTLGDVMALFKTGKAHLGIVTNRESDIVKRKKVRHVWCKKAKSRHVSCSLLFVDHRHS